MSKRATKKTTKRGGNNNSNDSWMDDENDDKVFQEYVAKRKVMDALKTKTPEQVVVEFLETTTIPYVVIGGKAAAYYIKSNSGIRDSDLKILAVSSDDYDVMVNRSSKDAFIQDVVRRINEQTPVNVSLKENPSLDIYMVGWVENGTFKSIVDVHAIANEDKLPKLDDTTSKIKFVNKRWLCKELLFTLENRSSQDQVVKYYKRNARNRLLKCEDVIKNK